MKRVNSILKKDVNGTSNLLYGCTITIPSLDPNTDIEVHEDGNVYVVNLDGTRLHVSKSIEYLVTDNESITVKMEGDKEPWYTAEVKKVGTALLKHLVSDAVGFEQDIPRIKMSAAEPQDESTAKPAGPYQSTEPVKKQKSRKNTWSIALPILLLLAAVTGIIYYMYWKKKVGPIPDITEEIGLSSVPSLPAAPPVQELLDPTTPWISN